MDTLDFLDSKEPEEVVETPEQEAPAEAPETQQPEEPQADTQQGPARGPDGKFVSKEAKPEPVMVPLAALQETRDKVRDLEARLAQNEQPRQQQNAPQAPDMFADPEGYQRFQNEQVQRAIYNERYATSQRFAVMQHGEETVKAAVDWAFQRAQNDPHFNAQALSNPDPIGFAIASYQRDQLVSQVQPGEFEKFKAWQAAQAATEQPQQQPNAAPPASIASMPSSGGGAAHIPTGPGQAFDSLFTR